MIAEPIISPDFTIEDIHKIREYHYELTKDMTTQEKINFYNEGGRTFLAEMEKRKLQKSVKQVLMLYWIGDFGQKKTESIFQHILNHVI